MVEENVAIRLKGFIDYLGISSSQFADQCGIPRPSLSQLLNGRNKKISDVLVGQIHSTYPELSVLWLMFGEGPMLVKSEDNDNENESDPNDLTQTVLASDPSLIESDNNRNENKASYKDNIGYHSNQVGALLAEKDKTIQELRKEIELLRKHPRRVAQITVYYDDSTFETFFPGGAVTRGR